MIKIDYKYMFDDIASKPVEYAKLNIIDNLKIKNGKPVSFDIDLYVPHNEVASMLMGYCHLNTTSNARMTRSALTRNQECTKYRFHVEYNKEEVCA